MKKLLTLFMVLLVLFASCGGKEESTASAPADEAVLMDDFTLSMLYSDNANYAYDANWMVWDIIKENTGASFEINAVPESDYKTKVQLAFNAGELPDIVTKTMPTSEQIASGLLLPISDYEDRMPNFQALIEKYDYRQALDNTKVEGKYFFFPVKAHKYPIQAHQWMIRSDVFKKNNIPVPTTLDEVLSAGKKLKEIYPDSVPITNRFAQGNLMGGMGPAFGGIAGWSFGTGMNYDAATKTWEFFPTTDAWREMCAYVNTLLEAGVLDPEWHTLDSVNYEQLVTQGKTFIMYDWSMNVTRYHNEGTKLDPDFHVNTIVPPQGPYGDYAVGWSAPWTQFWCISAEIAEKDYFASFLNMMDWLYTDEAEILMTFGREGESYYVEDGVHYRVDPENIDWFAKAGLDNNSLAVREHEDFLFNTLDDVDRAAFKEMGDKKIVPIPAPASPLNGDEIEESGFKCVGLSDYVITTMMEFIEGERPLDDANWKEFVEGCEAKGSLWLEETYNAAEKRANR